MGHLLHLVPLLLLHRGGRRVPDDGDRRDGERHRLWTGLDERRSPSPWTQGDHGFLDARLGSIFQPGPAHPPPPDLPPRLRKPALFRGGSSVDLPRLLCAPRRGDALARLLPLVQDAAGKQTTQPSQEEDQGHGIRCSILEVDLQVLRFPSRRNRRSLVLQRRLLLRKQTLPIPIHRRHLPQVHEHHDRLALESGERGSIPLWILHGL
jgi:hypothetical protein